MSKSRPRIAAIGGFMEYFEPIMGPDSRRDRNAHLDHTIERLGTVAELHNLGLLVDAADEARLTEAVSRLSPDVLLVVPTMATPPGPMVRILEAAPKAPVVIACAHGLEDIDAGYGMAELCRHSANVGASMVESLLRRRGREPVTLVGFLSDPGFHERLQLAARAAATARRLDGLRIARLGVPMPGYDHVGLDAGEAEASSMELVDIPLDRWEARFAAVSSDAIDAFIAGLPQRAAAGTQWQRDADLERAARLAVALADLAAEENVDCGSLTCRGPFGVGLDGGAIGCLATTAMTSIGIPFSATGDLVTAVAMFIGRSLGGATLYCELDAIDRARDAFLVANTGEGDWDWVPENGYSVIRPARDHSGRDVPGVVLQHDLRPGPATMVAATLDRTHSERLTLLAMQGGIGKPARTSLKITQAWFQTARRPAATAMEHWIGAGATHHGALSAGHLAEAVGWVGRFARLPTRIVADD
ncbi:MAG: hypothetical protein ABS76_11190 [Pelagibacterium sp. SCN 64-44]|nr:MAG: hypothetical protein ABS76_11190 [Pelagibacterium sp. SCN 64-44]